MIVDPDFPDHWKTRMLVDELKDEAAPVYLLRLWAHCQNRKQDCFDNLPPAALKALCRFTGHANQLESAMVASGFVRRDEDGILKVEGWADYNAGLLTSWENGRKGGRPPKKTHGLPAGNPRVTHGQPGANPDETDKSREEEIREEEPPAKPAVRVYGENFEKWWKVYPRRESKGYAQKKFLLALKDLVPVHGSREKAFEWLMMRTRAYADSPKGRGDKQYIPHPATWLEGKKFHDDDDTWLEAGRTGSKPVIDLDAALEASKQ